MFRLFAFILIFFSFDSYSLYSYRSLNDSSLANLTCTIATDISTCSLPSETVQKYHSYYGKTFQCTANGKYTWNGGALLMNFTCHSEWEGIDDSDTNRSYTLVAGGSEGCSTSEELYSYANGSCASLQKKVLSIDAASIPQCLFECEDYVSPARECENLITQQCANNFGFGSSSYSENGDGSSSCSGTCSDGSIPKAEEECDPSNKYCDVVEDPSELDFSSGATGSSVDPSTTTIEDSEFDVEYTPDGSTSDSSTDMSSLQGDKLINEVIATRNDNTKNLASTTETTNQTIVEKSDDIQETISNSANGIIDAVNDATPFYDGNIVDAVKELGSGIDGLGDKIDGLGDSLGGDFVTDLTPANFSGYDNLFRNELELKALTDGLKSTISVENSSFYNDVKQKFNFSSGDSGGYQANNLDLGKWGSHDVSLARFADFFGGVGNIVYFLAALSALTIVLGGIKI